MNNTKTKKKQLVDANLGETLRSVTSGVKDSITEDLIKKSASDVWKQFLGVNNEHTSGDLQEGQEINLSAHKKKQEQQRAADVAPGYDYREEILHGSERHRREENYEMQQDIQQIIYELKQLAASSKLLQEEFKEVTVHHQTTQVGKYHKNFFQWVLLTIRAARMRVEDSGAWLSQVKGKKGQKNY